MLLGSSVWRAPVWFRVESVSKDYEDESITETNGSWFAKIKIYELLDRWAHASFGWAENDSEGLKKKKKLYDCTASEECSPGCRRTYFLVNNNQETSWPWPQRIHHKIQTPGKPQKTQTPGWSSQKDTHRKKQGATEQKSVKCGGMKGEPKPPPYKSNMGWTYMAAMDLIHFGWTLWFVVALSVFRFTSMHQNLTVFCQWVEQSSEMYGHSNQIAFQGEEDKYLQLTASPEKIQNFSSCLRPIPISPSLTLEVSFKWSPKGDTSW